MIHLSIPHVTKQLGALVGGLLRMPRILLDAAWSTHKFWGERLRSDLAKQLDREFQKQAEEIRVRYQRTLWYNRQHEFSGAGAALSRPIAGMSLKEIEEFAHFYFWKQRVMETIRQGGDVSRFTFTDKDVAKINPPSIRHSKYETPYNYLPPQDMNRMFPNSLELIKIQHVHHTRETVLLFEPKAMHRSFPGMMMGDWSMPANKEAPIRAKTGKEITFSGTNTLNEGYKGSYDIMIRPNDPIFVNNTVVKIAGEEIPRHVRFLKDDHKRKTFYKLKHMLRQYGYEV